ncbi:uncharacterized protein LOC141770126 [Sebastes fasciatus]|uniref:uncharacterized protein LOC141770126 n=1 Tax=Sebastes fasciatus TaxID=394691 RepID=UPI003D9E7802
MCAEPSGKRSSNREQLSSQIVVREETDIKGWTSQNFLVLNKLKTEVVLFGPPESTSFLCEKLGPLSVTMERGYSWSRFIPGAGGLVWTQLPSVTQVWNSGREDLEDTKLVKLHQELNEHWKQHQLTKTTRTSHSTDWEEVKGHQPRSRRTFPSDAKDHPHIVVKDVPYNRVSGEQNCSSGARKPVIDGVTFWPNYKNDERVNRAVRKAEEPGPDWQSYDVRVVKSCDLKSEEEEEEVQSKRRPKPIHFFGDSDDDSEEESPLKKRARGPAKPSPQPPAPIIPPPPRCVPSSVTVALPPPVAPPSPTPPAVEQTPSSSQVYRPTWRGGRCGSDTMTCSAAEVHIMSLLEYIKHQQEQLIAKVNYLTSKNPAGQEMERPVPVQFPLGSMEEVENFGDWLKDPANSQLKQRVISSLATIGGHDTKRVTWNILAHMFHDDVGRRINWKGINGEKKNFQPDGIKDVAPECREKECRLPCSH